jgi:hypothetical protein
MSVWRRSMSSTRKMSEHPRPPYNLPTGEAAEAADAGIEAVIEVAEAALGFTSVAAAAAVEAAAVEAAGGGAIEWPLPLPQARLPLMNSTPAFSSAFLIAAKVSRGLRHSGLDVRHVRCSGCQRTEQRSL